MHSLKHTPKNGLIVFLGAGLIILFALTACERNNESPGSTARAPTQTNVQTFQVRGVIISVKPGAQEVEIKHEEVPGYMPAMTMPFEVRDGKELAGLSAGQAIEFSLHVADTEAWIDQIRPRAAAATNGPPAGASVRVAKDVEPLKPGDPMPDYVLTNQFGQAFRLSDYQGQALAITFLFTRCPFPTFCPRMADNFEQAQAKLLAASNTPSNWHLLTISFDPAFDSPAVLKAYAEAHNCKPDDWTFATGSLVDITALGEQLGLAFWHDPSGSLSHNLRTAVIDASGRLRKVYQGNEWTPDELVAELRAASQNK